MRDALKDPDFRNMIWAFLLGLLMTTIIMLILNMPLWVAIPAILIGGVVGVFTNEWAEINRETWTCSPLGWVFDRVLDSALAKRIRRS